MYAFKLPYQHCIRHITAPRLPPRFILPLPYLGPLVIIDASMELTLVVVLRTDLPAPELPAFVEPVDGVESA